MTQTNPLKSTQFQNRLKKIMQADEDVGKVAAGATYLVGKCHQLVEKLMRLDPGE
jgi:hypothetical protein